MVSGLRFAGKLSGEKVFFGIHLCNTSLGAIGYWSSWKLPVECILVCRCKSDTRTTATVHFWPCALPMPLVPHWSLHLFKNTSATWSLTACSQAWFFHNGFDLSTLCANHHLSHVIWTKISDRFRRPLCFSLEQVAPSLQEGHGRNWDLWDYDDKNARLQIFHLAAESSPKHQNKRVMSLLKLRRNC